MQKNKSWIEKNIFIVILLITIASVFINGYAYGTSDAALRGSMRELKIDKDLYKNDPAMGMAAYHISFVDLMLTPLYKKFGNESTSFFVYVIIHYFIFLSIYFLAKSMFPDYKVALLSVLFLMIDKPSIGNNTLLAFIGERLFALPFMFLGFMYFFKKKYLMASFMIGIATNFHIYTGAAIFLMFFIYMFFNRKQFSIKELIKASVVYVVTSLPFIIWVIRQKASTNILISPFVLKIMNLIVVHHYFILSWFTPMYLERWLRFFIFLLLIFIAYKNVSSKTPDKKKMHKCVGWLFWILVAFIPVMIFFTYVIPLTYIMNIQFIRNTHLIIFIGAIYVSKYLIDNWKKDDAYTKLTIGGLGAAFFIGNFKAISIFLVFLFALKFKEKRLLSMTASLAGILVFIASTVATFNPIKNIVFLKIGSLSFFIIIFVFLGILLIEILWKRKMLRTKINYYAALVFLVFFITIIGSLHLRYDTDSIHPPFFELSLIGSDNPIGLASFKEIIKEPRGYVTKSIQYGYVFPRNDFEDTQNWAKLNTKKDDTFITPPYLYGFRMYSHRPIVGEWLETNMVVLDEGYAKDIWGRMTSLCNSEIFGHCDGEYGFTCASFCKIQYNNLTTQQFANIAKKYNATYAVVEKPKLLDFNVVYENTGFRVYSMK